MKGTEQMDAMDQAALAAKTDEGSLEILITENKDFILRCASRAAGRFLTDSDDEWSVALMAFHEAVGAYQEDKGHFEALASTVIRRRVIDYLRSERRYDMELSVAPETFGGELEEDPTALQMEVRSATAGLSETQESTRPGTSATRDEIDAVQQLLSGYGFSFFDLTECSPKAGKTKDQCGKAVAVLMLLDNPPLMEKMRGSKTLPIKELSLASGVNKKVLERHRKYIIAAAEILDGDFPILGEYLSYIRKAVT